MREPLPIRAPGLLLETLGGERHRAACRYGSPGPQRPPFLDDPLTELSLIVAVRIASETPMTLLHHHPFCPHSRFVRLALAEMGLEAELVEERPWERRVPFLALNPAGTVPVLVDDGGLDRKSTRLNSSHANISYAVFCLKKKKHTSNEYTSRLHSRPYLQS